MHRGYRTEGSFRPDKNQKPIRKASISLLPPRGSPGQEHPILAWPLSPSAWARQLAWSQLAWARPSALVARSMVGLWRWSLLASRPWRLGLGLLLTAHRPNTPLPDESEGVR